MLEISQIIVTAFSQKLEDQTNNCNNQRFEIVALKIKLKILGKDIGESTQGNSIF